MLMLNVCLNIILHAYSAENNTNVLCESYDTMTPSFIEANETQTDDMICPYYKNIIYNVMENGSSCSG